MWDWNGTLFNDMSVCISVMNEILLQKNLRPISDIDRYRALFCFPVKEYYAKLHFDFEKDTFDTLATTFIEKYAVACSQCKLYDGAIDVIRRIKNAGGIQQLIVSVTEINHLKQQMAPFEMAKYFDYVLGIDDHHAESKVELAKSWVSAHDVDCTKALFIGDTIHDFEVSQAIGCDCILIAKGHQSVQTLLATKAHVVSDITNIVKYIL